MSRDLGVTGALRELVPEWSVEGFAISALLGDLVVIVPVLALVYLTAVLAGLRQSNESRRDEPLCPDRTAVLIAVVFGGLALVVLLKAAFSMPRPSAELHAVSASEHGFPSGHTMAATVFWGGLALWSSVASHRARFAAAGVVVSVVGFSRLALGVHYFVDVVASVLFGGVYLAVAAWIVGDRPTRAFALAVGIAVLATAVAGVSGRALLALSGTAGAALGWWLLERPPVRRLLVRAYDRSLGGSLGRSG